MQVVRNYVNRIRIAGRREIKYDNQCIKCKNKNVMQLNQKAKARREQGLFVAEGRKMFLEAPESWVSQVFVSRPFPGMKS